MFNLGSFSSIIPFVILALTYFAGITTYSLSFAQAKIEQKKLSEKTIANIEQEDLSSISIESFMQAEDVNYIETVKLNSCLSLHILESVKQKKEFNSPPFYSENFERSLYMRPPPFLLISLV